MTRKSKARTKVQTPNVLALDGADYDDGKRSLAVAPAEMRRTAQQIIDATDEHRHLKMGGACILLMVERAAGVAGKLTAGERVSIGKAWKARPRDKVLAGLAGKDAARVDFLIKLSGDWLALVAEAEGAEGALGKLAALIDHELCHCGAKVAGEFLEPEKVPERRRALGEDLIEVRDDFRDAEHRCLIRYYARTKDGELTWKLRKHDVEEFHGVIARRGAWCTPLSKLVDVLHSGPAEPLFETAAEGEEAA